MYFFTNSLLRAERLTSTPKTKSCPTRSLNVMESNTESTQCSICFSSILRYNDGSFPIENKWTDKQIRYIISSPAFFIPSNFFCFRIYFSYINRLSILEFNGLLAASCFLTSSSIASLKCTGISLRSVAFLKASMPSLPLAK